MAVSPTKLSAAQLGAGVLSSPPVDWRFLLSRANSSRAMDAITLIQRDEPWLPGMFVTCSRRRSRAGRRHRRHPLRRHQHKAGPRSATVVTRDAEVEDAYLIYGAMVVKDVHERPSQLAPSSCGRACCPTPPPAPSIPARRARRPSPASRRPHRRSRPRRWPILSPPASRRPRSRRPSPTKCRALAHRSPRRPPCRPPMRRWCGARASSDEEFRQESQRQERERQERERTPPAPTPPPPEAPRT